MTRIPGDVSVHLFSRTPARPCFLMLRRTPERGGFWQGVSGARAPVLDRGSTPWLGCAFEEADAMLDWPIEQDALTGRRAALRIAEALTRRDTAS